MNTDNKDLAALRKALGLTQSEMAEQIGLSPRAYHDVESGKAPYRLTHRLAAERAALALAVERRNPMLAPAAVRRDALDFVELIRGSE